MHHPPRLRRVLQHALAGALIAVFFLQSFLSSLVKSPSSDEPAHIAAGLSYLQKGVFVPNPEHPPLLKEIAAISLLLAGIRLPEDQDVSQMLTEPPGRKLERDVGIDVIARGGPARVMFWARLPLIILSTCLGIAIYLWGRAILGDIAAMGALFLFALDPNLVAHSEFVTTDMGLTVFMTVFFFSLWSYLRRPGTARLIWCGLAMGMLLCAKFSAVFMIPVALVLMVAAALRPPRTEGQNTVRRLATTCGHFAVIMIVASLVVLAIYFSPSGLSAYAFGLGRVYADHNPNFLAYMAGELRPRFTSYFAIAWLLKEPLASIGAVIVGSVTLILTRRLTVLDKLFIFLPPVVLFIACTAGAQNMGIRYLIPAFPFLYLAGGAGLAMLIRNRSGWLQALGALLCVWIAVAAVGIYPDHLSYFNETACLLREPARIGWDGGTNCGFWWLDDSNTDWGQGLQQLRNWRDRHPDSRPTRMAYFGSFPPEFYGIIPEQIYVGDPAPGLYIISAKWVSRAESSWPRTVTPAAIVGHALYIYDIRAKPGIPGLEAKPTP